MNMYKRPSQTAYRQRFDPEPLRRCWKDCLEHSSFHARKRAAEDFNRQSRWKKRGLAMIPMKYTIGVPVAYYHQVRAVCHLQAQRGWLGDSSTQSWTRGW